MTLHLAHLYGEKIRFLTFINRFKYLDINTLSLPEILTVFGGRRLITVFIGYSSIFHNFGLGHGLVAYQLDFQKLADFANVNLMSIDLLPAHIRTATELKIASYGGAISLETGIVGLSVLFLLLSVCYLRIKRSTNKVTIGTCAFKFTCFAIATLLILFYTTISFPTPWVLLAYACAKPPSSPRITNHSKSTPIIRMT